MTTSGNGSGSDERTELLGGSDAAAPGDSEIGPGSRIGPYTLIEAIGEGGMGQVFLAEQHEPIRRRVAIKLIRRQIADALSLAYFEIERQALARMEHPAIARVYDAGRTGEGFPYFAMEYVDGVSLRRWNLGNLPSLAVRLAVFTTLVRGVQHAHERGIVHRDLKPDNILITTVDGQAQPKLIDFGIAIGVDGSGTTSAHHAGTTDYMSPEQFAGSRDAIDARSDVFSLGVILLDLLQQRPRRDDQTTLRPTDLHARLRASLEGRPDADLRSVPRELRFLLARALAPERDARYESASALADDLQRFREGRPLHAVPAQWLYDTRKFIQRHRVPVALGATIALAVIAGLAATLWSLQRAEREAARSRATAGFLSTVLSSVDPDIARDLDKTLLRKVLDEAAERAQRELAGQPDVLIEIQDVIARSYTGLADLDRALEHATHARDGALALHGADSEQAHAILHTYSEAMFNSGKTKEVEPLLREALAAMARTRQDESAVALRLRHQLGWALRDLGRFEEAGTELQAAADGMSRTLGDTDFRTIQAQTSLAITLADRDRFDEAIPMLRELIERQSTLRGADHPSTLRMRNSLAVFYMQARRFADGERELRSLLEPYERLFGPDNANVMTIVGNLGGALRQQGKVEESGPYYLRAMEGNRRIHGTDHTRSIMTLHNYGNWLLDAGQAQDALRVQREALDAAGRALPPAHPTVGEIMTSIGKANIALGHYAEAERDLLASIDMKIAARGPGNSRLRLSREALVELYTAWNRPDDAARHAEPPASTE